MTDRPKDELVERLAEESQSHEDGVVMPLDLYAAIHARLREPCPTCHGRGMEEGEVREEGVESWAVPCPSCGVLIVYVSDDTPRTGDTEVPVVPWAEQGTPPDLRAPTTEEGEREALERLQQEGWGLVPVDYPIGMTGDRDVEWTVVEYHMDKPRERIVGRGRTAREALRAALTGGTDG